MTYSIVTTCFVRVENFNYFLFHVQGSFPSKHLKAGHNRPASETPFEWHVGGGPMMTRYCVLTGFVFPWRIK